MSSSRSPRPPNSALSPPPRQDSGPPSPRVSPTTTMPFSFPTAPTNGGAPPPPPVASSSRFQAAFAAYPSAASRHVPYASISSVNSDSSLHLLASGSADDDELPTVERAFDAMQRELGAPEGARGLGLMDGGYGGPNRGFGPSYSRGMERLYEEPEEYDTVRGLPQENGYEYGREEEPPVPFRRNGSAARLAAAANGTTPGTGRPASMDLDNSMAFLLSPPPSFDPTTPSAKTFAAAAASETPRPRERERTATKDRIFPAPLLLKSDRNYSYGNGNGNGSGGGSAGGSGSGGPSSPVLSFPPTAPLSFPRRPSAVSGGGGWNGSASHSPGQSFQRSWTRDREREGPMGPPETTRTNLPYHRRQQSSTSSLSHGSFLPYNNSYSYEPRHALNVSASTSTAVSPSIGFGRNPQAFPPPSTSSSAVPSAAGHGSSASVASTTFTGVSSSDPPISSQALITHVRALRSASSPMGLSQSQGPLTRSATPAYSSQHQRNRSAGSATATEADEPPPAYSLNGTHLASVRLETVDLSHKRIADVPIEVVYELRNEVEKLALGYNLLKDLPPHLNRIGNRLKYLNVRVNMLTTFPQVLCEMPSLEILDISRNKIRMLPKTPGTLLNLKVFSCAKNRIKRLPIWFTFMSLLKVLKIDHNPLEWPPREVASFPLGSYVPGSLVPPPPQPMSKQEEADEMARWLPQLIRWMKENRASEMERERVQEAEKREADKKEAERRPVPGLAVEHNTDDEHEGDRDMGIRRTASGRLDDDAPRARRAGPPLPSIDLDAAAEEAPTALPDPSVRHSRNASHTLAASAAPSPRPALRAKKSLPDLRQNHADILADRRTGTTLEEEPPRPVVPSLEGPLRRLKAEGHPGLQHSVSAKAALPTQNISATPLVTTCSPPTASSIVRSQSARPPAAPSPPAPLPRQDTTPLPPRQQPQRPRIDLDAPPKGKRTGMERPVAGEYDRNSGAYFRRLSMLPVSTIAKTVPVVLLQFADAIRGILFSLAQIYSALRQFVVFASQDRLPAPVARLMSSADTSMSALINALDRFDSLSRRGTPPTPIVRDVFASCRDNVVVFGKLVAALQPQLKALTATADARYTRTLLLMLYGSMGEIANSWTTVAPLFTEAEDPAETTLVLQPPTPSPQLESATPSSSHVPGSAAGGSNGSNGPRLTRQRSTTRRHAGSFSVEDVQLGAVLPPAEIPPVPALPLSMEDGGLLASTPGVEATSSSSLPSRPPLSARSSISSIATGASFFASRNRERPTFNLAMPPQLGYEEMAQRAFDQPITPGVQGFINRTNNPNGPFYYGRWNQQNLALGSLSNFSNSLGLSASSSVIAVPAWANAVANTAPPLMPVTTSNPNASSGPYRSHRISRPVSTLNADETFLDQAESTMSIAADVYGMLLDSFEDPIQTAAFLTILGGRRKLKELSELCRLGSNATATLRLGVDRIRGSDGRGRLRFTMEDAREVGDSAFEYVQYVIRTAKLIRTISQDLAFPQQVRDAVGQLTLGTREFARLLSHGHTSFRPLQTQGTGVGRILGGSLGSASDGFGELPEVRSRDFATAV
ncbi:hypothetical protein JCM11641_003173 [Rhodosporidiobolus odoratus]